MTTLIIIFMLCFSYLLIATGHLTGVNKSAIAVFLATIGWVLYVCWGTGFVESQHAVEYGKYVASHPGMNEAVKYFIYENVFLRYVGQAAAIVLFMLATMSIIEILDNNGCFDFITSWIRTRNPNKLLWSITFAAFFLSANLDTLTTSMVMLVLMHSILKNRRQRMLVGSAIVLAATCGGCFTVIGDTTGLILWGKESVTATNFSAYLFLPAATAWIIPTALISRELPSRLDIEWGVAPYRGDDTRLNTWQRLMMFVVGIGGLWFIPTFKNITKLPPFLGALCVLSILWVVNEAFNRKLYDSDQMSQRRPRVLQYGTIQQILFVLGIMLGLWCRRRDRRSGRRSQMVRRHHRQRVDYRCDSRPLQQPYRLLHRGCLGHHAVPVVSGRLRPEWHLLESAGLLYGRWRLSALRGQHQRYSADEYGAHQTGVVFQDHYAEGAGGMADRTYPVMG